MRNKLLLIVMLCSGLSFAQVPEQQLFEGYLAQDLSSWDTFITTANWDQMSDNERTLLINHEYGFIPFMSDQNDPRCRQLLDAFWQHIEAHKNVLTPSQYATYTGAAHAFEYLLDKSKIFSDGMQSFKLAKQAVEADPNNPIALSLKGNVDFYAPKLFGGSKKKAMDMFLLSEQLMHNDPMYKYWWNYPAMLLCIAQCYEKMGNKEAAIQKCQQILREYPNFVFVRDEYLPSLLSK